VIVKGIGARAKSSAETSENAAEVGEWSEVCEHRSIETIES
jgi:hypothetical protein